MTWPTGLTYEGRIATDGRRFYFDCQRDGHKRIRRVAETRPRAQRLRAEHDARYHLRIDSRTEGPTLGEIADEFLAHLDSVERAGELDPQTVRYYRQYVPDILAAIDEATPAAGIRQLDVVRAVTAWRGMSKSKGATIKKRLMILRRMQRWAGISPGWTIPDTVQRMVARPEARRKARDYDEETLDRLQAALPPGSLERAYFRTKRETVFREVELRELRVSQVDQVEGVFRYTLHAKKATYAHTFPVTPGLMAELQPHIEGKDPDAYVFSLSRSGRRRLTHWSLRKRFLAASERAGIDPPITALGQIRHRTITLLVDHLGPYEAQKAVGHRSVRTTEGYVRTPDRAPATEKAAEVLRRVAHGVTDSSAESVKVRHIGEGRARRGRKR